MSPLFEAPRQKRIKPKASDLRRLAKLSREMREQDPEWATLVEMAPHLSRIKGAPVMEVGQSPRDFIHRLLDWIAAHPKFFGIFLSIILALL